MAMTWTVECMVLIVLSPLTIKYACALSCLAIVEFAQYKSGRLLLEAIPFD